ncbi:hypothetical protein RFI_29202, partial [Reticulomyxa filosa]
ICGEVKELCVSPKQHRFGELRTKEEKGYDSQENTISAKHAQWKKQVSAEAINKWQSRLNSNKTEDENEKKNEPEKENNEKKQKPTKLYPIFYQAAQK